MWKINLYITILLFSISLKAQTVVEGNINENTTWYEEASPYLIKSDLTVSSGKILTVNPGVEIIISDDKLISIKGSLLCNGLPGKNITFRAENTNWGGIYVDRSASEVSFKFTDFFDGGRSSYTQSSVIMINQSEVFAEYCTFSNSYKYAITSFREGYADLGGGKLNSRGYNTFEGFAVNRYAIVNKSKIELDAAYNCWDGQNPDDVVYDNKDKADRGEVFVEPVNENCEPQKPDKVEIFFPGDSARDMPVYLNLKWHNVNDVSGYDVQLSESFNFDTLKIKDKTQDSIYAVFNLKYGTRYFWRVRAYNFVGNGNWSDTFTFMTYDTSKPYRTEITYPANNSETDCEILFEWEEIENADNYEVVIYNDLTEIDTVIQSNNFYFNQFRNSTDYICKVRGLNRNGKGKWSEEVNFRIADSFSQSDSLDFPTDSIITFLYNSSGTEIIYEFNNKIYKTNILTQETIELAINSKVLAIDIINTNSIKDHVYYSDGSLVIAYDNFDKFQSLPVSGIVESIEIYDLNNEGNKEIICKINDNNSYFIQVFEIKDKQLKPKNINLPATKFSKVIINDIDLDDDKDILIFNEYNAKIYMNNNDEFVLSENEIFYLKLNKLYINDYNYDGYSDILIQEDKQISLISNLSGVFQKDTIVFDRGYDLVGLRDFDLNGSSDMMLVDSNNVLYLYDLKNNIIENLNIAGENVFSLKMNSDDKPDLIVDDNIYNNNKCAAFNITKPKNLRYSLVEDDILLEWDRAKINNKSNYNIRYEIVLLNLNNEEIWNYSTQNNFYQIRSPEDAEYNWKVRAVYNNDIFSAFDEFQGLYTKNVLPKPPASWAYENKTGLNTTILLRETGNIMIDTLKVAYGDALGIFYIRDTSLVCGGYSYINSDKVILTAWGDNAQTADIKDGFEYTENFRFKFWDASEKMEIPVNVQFDKGIGWFKPDTLSEIKYISLIDTTKIYVEGGRWNYVASDVVPFNPFFNNILDENLSISNLDNEIYDLNNEQIKYWNINEGYKVYSEVNDSILITGSKLQTEYNVINLQKNKWYLLPVITQDTVRIEKALGSILPKIVLLKNEKGEIFSPEYNLFQFEYLCPNKSYEIFLNENAKFILKDSSDAEKQQDHSKIEFNFYNDITQNSGNNATLLLKIIDHKPGEAAVFLADELVGSAIVNSDTTFIILKGSSPTGNIYGASDGEALEVKYYLYSGEQYKLPDDNIFNELTQTNESGLKYKQNSFYSMEFDIDDILSVQNEKKQIVDISPIPADEFIFVNSDKFIKNLQILDLSGRSLLSQEIESFSAKINISQLPNGIYFVRIKGDSFIDDKKIILRRNK